MTETLRLYWNFRSYGFAPARAWASAVRLEREMRTWVFEA